LSLESAAILGKFSHWQVQFGKVRHQAHSATPEKSQNVFPLLIICFSTV
jgi:hypothetical protein